MKSAQQSPHRANRENYRPSTFDFHRSDYEDEWEEIFASQFDPYVHRPRPQKQPQQQQHQQHRMNKNASHSQSHRPGHTNSHGTGRPHFQSNRPQFSSSSTGQQRMPPAAATVPKEGDLYATLNVSSSATDREITLAYRRLALQYHPDKNKDPGAEDKFKSVTSAYSVLSDRVSYIIVLPARLIAN
jgi:DnaJ-domain-containing protein 1